MRPPSAVPARTTEKTLRWQGHTARLLQERREQEWREQQELEQAHKSTPRMRSLVKQMVGPIEPLEEKIERIVVDKRQAYQRVVKEKLRDLQKIKERVKRQPLLMEQADSLVRAR